MLTSGEITDMRATLDASMPDGVAIFKRTKTPDNSGGFSETWASGGPVIARVSPLGGGLGGAMAEIELAGRIGTAEAWLLTLPDGTDIDAPDRVVWGVRGFEVATINAPRSWELCRRVVLVELA